MKVFVYKDKWDDSLLYSLATVDSSGYKFLGFQEQPEPVPEKKTVVVEKSVFLSAPLSSQVPVNARNIKLTYEIEEQ